MQGWILSHLRDSPSITLLLEACRARGHLVDLVHPEDCRVELRGDRLPSAVSTSIVPHFVVTRMGSTAPLYALVVVRALKRAGVACINDAASLERSRDKIRMMQELAVPGVPMPASFSPNRGCRAFEALDRLGGAPVVVKLTRGSKGAGVMLCESRAALQSAMDLLWSLDEEFLLQRAVTDAFGVDLRILVFEGRATAAMRRTSTNGDFRANLHGGGVAEPIVPTSEQRRIAETATARLGLVMAGVDLLDSAREGPLLIEVNGSPGLAGISAATGRDLAGEVVRLVEQRVLAPVSSRA